MIQRTSTQTPLIRRQIARQLKEQIILGSALIKFRGPIVKGWLNLRYAQCRKGNCQCTKGRPHGPFLYATMRVKGKNVYRYVGKTDDGSLVRQIKDYQDFRQKLARLRKLSSEIDSQYRKLESKLTRPAT